MSSGFRGILNVDFVINEQNGVAYITKIMPKFDLFYSATLANLKIDLGSLLYNVASGHENDFEADDLWTIGNSIITKGNNELVYGIDEAIRQGVDLHYVGVYKDDKEQFRVCPHHSMALIVTGKGKNIREANRLANNGAMQIQSPTMNFRPDIGLRLCIEREVLYGFSYIDKLRYNSMA
jgi:phosphoribosylamine-glycine ligase